MIEKLEQIKALEQENQSLKSADTTGENPVTESLKEQIKALQQENQSLKSGAPAEHAETERLKAACTKQQAMLKKLAAERQRESSS